jgi:hypothetical protein
LLTVKPYRWSQSAARHELVSTRDPAHVPVMIRKITTGRPKTQCHRSQLVAEHELVSTRDPAHVPVLIRKITTKTNTPTATAMTGPNCKASCED